MNTELGRQYYHEDYSAKIIDIELADVIENHDGNANYEIKASDVANLISGTVDVSSRASTRRLIWRPLITSQLDADRCDYLLRDSFHAGVSYGKYDLDRILATINLGLNDSDDPVIAIEEGGWHAAEGLIIARYSMFTQVYFHHTRQAFDHHVEQMLSFLLREEYGEPKFPLPDATGIVEYLKWDDWKVLGKVSTGTAGEHGQSIAKRIPFRHVWLTNETPNQEEIEQCEAMISQLGSLFRFQSDATKSWYSSGDQDLLIVPDDSQEPQPGRPLSAHSTIVSNMKQVGQRRVYVDPADRDEAQSIVHAYLQGRG